MDVKQLSVTAIKAMENAYAPYSGCQVGAALLTKSGKLYTGCNIENASYSVTVCAERVALFKAVCDGERDFSMLAVVGSKNGVIEGAFPPCGVCRQALAEFCLPDMPVYMVRDSKGSSDKFLLKDLLPYAFSLKER